MEGRADEGTLMALPGTTKGIVEAMVSVPLKDDNYFEKKR